MILYIHTLTRKLCQPLMCLQKTVVAKSSFSVSLQTPANVIHIPRRYKYDFSKEKMDPRRPLPMTSRERNMSTFLYLLSLAVLTVGASYAAVPLYRIFCQQTGYGGTTQVGHDTDKIGIMKPNKEKRITV